MALIAAHSLLSSFGCDVVTACAAARAGLSRAAPVQGFKFNSDTAGETEPLIAHAVPLLTRGFEGRSRLIRLLVGGLRELKARLPAGLDPAATMTLYLSWPDPERVAKGLDLIADDGARATARERTQDVVGDSRSPSHADALATAVRGAAAEAGWTGPVEVRHLSFAGHAGGAECLTLACDDLAKGRVENAVVGGVDSLLDADTIAWLDHADRLKLTGMPVGLMPGEAAAFVWMSSSCVAPEAMITASGLASEPKSLWSGATSVGVGLSQAIEQVAHAADWSKAEPAWALTDLNGEVYRANEWGHVVARLRASWPALGNVALWLPAASFGDTGAASALVALCMVVQAQRRKYAPARHAMIVSSSEGAHRSAVVVSATNYAPLSRSALS